MNEYTLEATYDDKSNLLNVLSLIITFIENTRYYSVRKRDKKHNLTCFEFCRHDTEPKLILTVILIELF